MQKGMGDGNNKNENGGYEAGSTNFYFKSSLLVKFTGIYSLKKVGCCEKCQ